MKKRNRLLLVGMVLVLLLLPFPIPTAAAGQDIWTSPYYGQVGARIVVYGYDFTPESNIAIT